MVTNGMDFFRAITVPVGSLKDPDVLTFDNMLVHLELVHLETTQHTDRSVPSRLPELLFTMLKTGEDINRIKKVRKHSNYDVIDQLCNEAAFSKLIPFQESPIDLHSLAELAVKATGVGLGAYAGFVASGGTPLVLITVPAGMILCGAAAGFGRALEEGLRTRILSLMGVPEKKQDKGFFQRSTKHLIEPGEATKRPKRSIRLDE
jgi:hypothetical protein